LFTITFSTTIHKSLLQNEIVQFYDEPSPFKLYDFLIYPSNANFKNCILPFISSSENLLKIFSHFQKLDSKVNLEKFLPYSRLKVTVVNLQGPRVAYIFENGFHPILISESICEAIHCDYIDKTIDENSICALFLSNKIFLLKSYILPKNQEVFAAYDESDDMFFVALKKSQNTLVAISHGIIKSDIKFPDYLNCILKAHNLNGLQKIIFKLINVYVKYEQLLWKCFHKTNQKLLTLITRFIADVLVLRVLFIILLSAIVFILLYIARIFPFQILSFLFEFFLFRDNLNDYGKFQKHVNIMEVWMLPYSFFCFFRLCLHCFANLMEYYGKNDLIKIKPEKSMWIVPYLIERKKYPSNICELTGITFFQLCLMFFGGFVFYYFSSLFFKSYGESNE